MANEQRMHPEQAQTQSDEDRPAPAETTPPSSSSVTEPPAGASGAAVEPAPQDLALMLEDARNKADEHWDQYLRTRAELENLRKRSERDLEQAHKYALEKLALELLPVRDSLEMGLSTVEGEGAGAAKLREGMGLTLKMLSQVMDKFGIRAIDPKGEKFNPDLHQAMATQEAAGVEPNTVLTVYQKGYMLHDRLIRPALVIVSRAAAPAAANAGENSGETGKKADEKA